MRTSVYAQARTHTDARTHTHKSTHPIHTNAKIRKEKKKKKSLRTMCLIPNHKTSLLLTVALYLFKKTTTKIIKNHELAT